MKKFITHDTVFQRTRALFLIVLLALTAACSTIRFSYNHGDTLLYWWLDAYVDFEGDQSDWVKRDIGELFQWHRKTQLHDYAALLGTFQRQLAGNPTQADLLGDYREMRSRTETLAMKAVPDMVDLARSLTPDQIAQMEERFKKKNDEYRRKFVSGSIEKRQEARFDKSMEQFKLWFGSFNRDQEAALRRASDARPLDSNIWLEERIQRQRKILALTRKIQQEKPSKEQTGAMITALVHEFFGRMDAPERKGFYDSYLNSTTNYILTAIRIATPAQKAHAQKRMQGWIDELNALAKEAK
jgi:predicted transcriptional regulator